MEDQGHEEDLGPSTAGLRGTGDGPRIQTLLVMSSGSAPAFETALVRAVIS